MPNYMTKQLSAVVCLAVFWLIFAGGTALAAPQEAAGAEDLALLSPESQRALVEEYCLGCHNPALMTGNLTLMEWDPNHAEVDLVLAEKMIRKVRSGVMPPAGASKPDKATLKNLAASIEDRIDRAAALNPNPGRRSLQRLNRAEYARTVRELLAIDVDVDALLPPDSLGGGFDNMADALTVSPALVEGYMRAASEISRIAVGDRDTAATSASYSITRTASQMRHVEGAPLGTRGGIAEVHNFPTDGEYVFTITFYGESTGGIFGLNNPLAEEYEEEIEVSIDGERVSVLVVTNDMNERNPEGLTVRTEPITVKAGPRRLAAAFIQRFYGTVDDIIRPIEHTIADQQVSTGSGISTLPHVQELNITGPFNATGISRTPSRTRIFTCRPTLASEEADCATEIVTDLATEAYRRSVTSEDLEGLMNFYRQGRGEGDFERGIRTALQAILASPNFVFRFEQVPPNASPGEAYRISDLELASRLSFFLWSTVPDGDLIAVAEAGRLREPGVLREQVDRMLRDPRSEALSSRFGAQWLRLGQLNDHVPDPIIFPQFDTTLAWSMRRETELLFDSVVREDRNILDLLTADYTFVDERLAKHYAIPGVLGNRYRRVSLTDENRFGVLGHASILTLTSIADRTSPVGRGKWVMQVLLGTSPPTPPPNVPELETETTRMKVARVLTLRERMEEHRANPTCAACHAMIDPIGFALENFDAMGRWRDLDHGMQIDATGVLFDGTVLDGPISLREAILSNSDAYLRNFAENLLSYGLGRRVEAYDMTVVRDIVRSSAQNNNRFSSYLMGIVESAPFQMRTTISSDVAAEQN